jgi:4-alpha-glucanotransferase
VFDAAMDELGALPLVAEDLGVITPPVERLRLELGLPGMVVLQFGFTGGPRNPHRPANHVPLLVVYTGTHDTETAVGWWDSLSPRARKATGLDPAEPHWSLIELALASPAVLSILPAQDVLGLGSEARMNRPGISQGNWRWRLEQGDLTTALAERLREATARNGRAIRP